MTYNPPFFHALNSALADLHTSTLLSELERRLACQHYVSEPKPSPEDVATLIFAYRKNAKAQ